MSKSDSPTKRAFRRFLKNIPGVFGLLIIAVAVIIAILGYLITPDSTPNANDQILQITNKPPGFNVKMLLRAKNRQLEKKNFFSRMLFGQDNPYELIPIHNYHFEEDKIVFQEYTGENTSEEKRLNLADLVYPVANEEIIYNNENNSITFTRFNGERNTATLPELRSKVERNRIEKQRFILGTDKFGRDIFSRLIIGVRISLSVGIVAVVISLLIGITIGAAAGFFRGRIDDVSMWFINVVWSIPTLLLVFAITLALGKGFWQIFVAVGLTMWVEAARIIRGQVMSLREQQFIEAAKGLGFNSFRIIRLHILPNVMGPLTVVAAANFAYAILIEAGLSFLGIGVQPPTPSWGGMLSENYGYIIGANPFLAIIPGIAIMLMVLAFNLVGNGFRDAMDVKTSLQG